MSDQQITLFQPAQLDPGASGWAILAPMAMEETRPHTEEEYLEQLKRLRIIGQGVQAWVGDVYNAMRENGSHGRAKTMASEIGFEPRTIEMMGYVCRSVEISVRTEISTNYPDITFKHFQVISPLEYDEQIHWLNEAGRGGWSVSQLRQAIRTQGEDWLPRSFNVWSPFIIEEWQQQYPGQIPGEILRNVLYYTTQKGDKVIDVFGGGGNMGMAAERMGRACVSYDIEPQFPGIVKHNALDKFPDSDANLVFLDPPYWGQKKGEYRDLPGDLSNMEIEPFYFSMERIIENSHAALAPGGYCVLIIGASQFDGEFYDHAMELYSRIKQNWRLVNRVSASYPTSQYSGNDVKRSIQDKVMLNLYTTLLFLQKT